MVPAPLGVGRQRVHRDPSRHILQGHQQPLAGREVLGREVDVLLAGVEWDQRRDRVTGEEDQDEAEDADRQQHERGLPESLYQVAGHTRLL